jgi:hypothetical protein
MEERVTSLFQPDTLLPEQFLDTFRRKQHLEPEKKLMLAILEDDIACFQKYLFARDGKGKTLFREAETWALEKGDGVFSFDSVCEILGFDPNYLRRGLAEWKQAALDAHVNKPKVYQLTPLPHKQRRGVSTSRRSAQRLRRAASR